MDMDMDMDIAVYPPAPSVPATHSDPCPSVWPLSGPVILAWSRPGAVISMIWIAFADGLTPAR